MTSSTATPSPAGQRGPADHAIREQIIEAAGRHFSHYGYGKTTVADLAAAIGFSKAYIYKFFDSKQAIGEAICGRCLGRIADAAEAAVASGETATEKYRLFFNALVAGGVELLAEDRKVYDIAAHSAAENWSSNQLHVSRMKALVHAILVEGRASGEFERKTPLDEATRAILQVMQPFMNPIMLQYNLNRIPEAPNEVASLVLRSLAP